MAAPLPPALNSPARPPRHWLQLSMPLGLSLAVHAALLLLLGGVAWRLSSPPAPEQESTEAFIAVGSPLSRAEKPAAPREESPPPQAAPSSAVAAIPSPAAPGPAPSPAIGRISIEPISGPAGTPATGAASAALDTGERTAVSFAGLSAKRATSVAYVIDASAPMIGVLPRVLAEVRASTSVLLPAQQVGIVIFHDGQTDSFSPRLVDATPRNLGRVADWLAHVESQGRSTPLEGLRAALALKPRPRVVFLLSRSIARSHGGQWEDGRDAILAELDSLNPIDPQTGQRRTVIKALQFLEPDPTGTMQAIAERHGGGGTTPDYRVLQAEELPR